MVVFIRMECNASHETKGFVEVFEFNSSPDFRSIIDQVPSGDPGHNGRDLGVHKFNGGRHPTEQNTVRIGRFKAPGYTYFYSLPIITKKAIIPISRYLSQGKSFSQIVTIPT